LPLKKIYLVRHGQTKFNQLNVVQGRGIDASLNDTGIKQANLFYQAYKNTSFDKIYISNLKRTYESVIDFIEDGIPYESQSGFDEISWGEHEGAKASVERNEYLKSIIDQWNTGNTYIKIAGGESPEDVAERQMPVVEKIVTAYDEVVLVCMHGRAIRILLCTLLGLPLSKMDSFEHHNLGLYVLDYKSGKFSINLTNSTSHLETV
jgi:broad specificity phosphatase PhoE